ncbi:hypothetical protein ZHAS_00018591 [Anopheles sinensis]|uniref:Uncharacterized protein n=1 Tax=Anopheles sinensis TaxID=74873 RepID=A0A084WJC9_ANOSI|nr:hypothetical protein ZHAS_00018591 [Anopheles sinensis]
MAKSASVYAHKSIQRQCNIMQLRPFGMQRTFKACAYYRCCIWPFSYTCTSVSSRPASPGAHPQGVYGSSVRITSHLNAPARPYICTRVSINFGHVAFQNAKLDPPSGVMMYPHAGSGRPRSQGKAARSLARSGA